MSKKVIIVTGAAGFLGSSITVALSPDYRIVAIDQRPPSSIIKAAVPSVQWEQLNIADAARVNQIFRRVTADFSQIDFVIHLAAYYHFGSDWRKEYEQTNIKGTENVVGAAINSGVQRIVFASSIAAMEPPLPGQMLNEKSPTSNYLPYAKSKSIGEDIIKKKADKLPAIVLRLGGIFSDWCELPPLFSLIKMWSDFGFFSRIMPGKGESGLPYMHRFDVVQIIKRCLALHEQLESFEVFLASQHGAVLHKDIFSSIRKTLNKRNSVSCITISPGFAKIGLTIKAALGTLIGKPVYEQPWMLKFLDRPWSVDNSVTQKKLNWHCSPGMGILERMPVILRRYEAQRSDWIQRNIRRNQGEYNYSD